MAFSDPKSVVAQFHLQPGMTVADFGTGSGAYALALDRAVGPEGKVYAIDIQKELLARLGRAAKDLHLHNIEVIRGDLEVVHGSTLADHTVDFVVIANLLFQTSAKYILVREAKRILKLDGRVALIDWSNSFGGLGPKPEAVVTPAEAKKIFAEAGFAFLNDFPAGDHHYGLMFNLAPLKL
ncbi:MAG: methyltransferase domain-containing protein [Candidatus Vogelbacteria bacterium]